MYAYAGNRDQGISPVYEVAKKAKIKKGVLTIKPPGWRFHPNFEQYGSGLKGKYRHRNGTAKITLTFVDPGRITLKRHLSLRARVLQVFPLLDILNRFTLVGRGLKSLCAANS